MNKKATRSPASDKWLFYNLIALIVCLPLPLGSNRIWAWSIAEAWIFVATACWLFLIFKGSITLPKHFKKSWFPLFTLAGFIIFTIFQLIAPDNGTKSIETLNELGWNLYSLDPHSTFQQLLKTLSYTCLFVLTTALVNTEKRVKLILQAFFFSGLFQASYGSFMTLSGIEQIFFIQKEAYLGKATGTFINRNHFANYLVMCIAAGTALLLLDLSQKKSANLKEAFIKMLHFLMSKKMLLRIGLAISVIGIVLSHSRMGNVSFFVSLSLAGLVWAVLTKRLTRKTIVILSSFILIDLLIVGNWFGFDKVQQRLQGTSASTETRDEVIRDTVVYFQDHMMTGTGGGSYYAVYPSYRGHDVNAYYDYAHNDYLQLLSEYGIIGTLFIALLVLSSIYTILMTMIKRTNATMQATAFCALMVIIALLMHSLVDFSLQIMANAASATILLALAWTARNLPTKTDKRHYN